MRRSSCSGKFTMSKCGGIYASGASGADAVVMDTSVVALERGRDRTGTKRLVGADAATSRWRSSECGMGTGAVFDWLVLFIGCIDGI